MKFGIPKQLFFAILALVATTMFPVCPEIELWGDDQGHFRYLLPDWHIDYIDGRVSLKQQADFLWAVQQKKTVDSFVLAEDIYHYSGNNQKVINAKYSHIKTSTANAHNSSSIGNNILTPILLTVRACKQAKIRHYNAECGQTINYYIHNASYNNKLTQQEVVDDLAASVTEVGRYKDCFRLIDEQHDYFSAQLAKLQKSVTTTGLQPESFIAIARRIRDHLVNTKTIHKLIEWNNIPHGFIFEGKWHIEQIKSGLRMLGYRHIKSIGNANVWDLTTEYSQCTSAQEQQDIGGRILAHALDLRSAFGQIFKEQHEQEQEKVLLASYEALRATTPPCDQQTHKEDAAHREQEQEEIIDLFRLCL